MLKNNKGITLIALVITIIILIILASVATISGMSAFNLSIFNNAKAQFQAMQNYTNTWYEEADKNREVLDYGEDLSVADATIVSTTIQEGTGNTVDTGFRYFSADYITNTLGIDGISYNFLINVSNATVLVYGGIRYQDRIYYSAEDFGINVIQYNNLLGEIQFETKIEEENIVIYNIQFPEGIEISKYRVQYQNEGDKYWETLTTDKKQEYEYKDNGVTVKDKNAWKILIPTINEEFFSNSQPIEGEDRELELLNIKIRIITSSSSVASREKNHTIIKRKETTVDKLELITSNIIMPVGATRKIIANPNLKEEIIYYAKINDNYYKIEKNAEGKYIIQEDITEIKDEVFELKAEVDEEDKNKVEMIINQDTKEITIMGKEENDDTIIMTVTCGEVRPKSVTCSIKVLSQLNYIDELLKDKDNITEEIKEILSEYEVIPQNESSVTDITIDYTSVMAINDSGIIRVTPIIGEEVISYYIKFNDNEFYKIIKDGNIVKVDRTKLENISKNFFNVSSNNNYVSVVSKNESQLEATITSGSLEGTSTITVVYGEITKKCNIQVKIIPKEASVANSSLTFSTNYGTIEVIWLDTSNNVMSEPNPPILDSNGESMTKVTWTCGSDGTWNEDSTAKSTWYNYTSNGTDRTDNTTSMWANAKTANGSYFVWIPRYAYRITYYDSQTSTTPTGYYDGWGMWQATDASVRYKLDADIEYVEYNGNRYIVHPAFCDGRDNNYANGEWDSNLSGFWMAKYEMRGKTSTALKSSPGVDKPLGGQGYIGDLYLLGRQALYGYTGISETLSSNGVNYTYTSFMKSHMTKHSEWGAVAYLTHSQYGRNGNEININNHSYERTGYGGKSTNSEYSRTNSYAFNTTTGVKASTTGNIYGIYDMSGGAEEDMAGFNALVSEESDLTNCGLKMVQEAKDGLGNYISTKYITVYGNATKDALGEIVYKIGKIGDGTKEVSVTRKFNCLV